MQDPVRYSIFISKRFIFSKRCLGETFEGADEDFHGEISPSEDLVIGHSDGSGHSLKVHATMRNHDGATLLGLVEGRAEPGECETA